MKKQVLSLVVSAAMMASMLPKPAFAADNTTTFPDMPNDWSTQALQNAINNGLLNGIDGKIAAGENLTRAQMAAIVTRAFGTNGKADLSSFGDVNTGDWFYDAMASSVLMEAFQGDGVNLNPNAAITRQEAFTVLARLFTLTGGNQSVLNNYTDGAQVADWAKDSMASMVAAGYVHGSDNMLNPQSSITRAEFAQVMDNLLKNYLSDGQLNVTSNGNAILNKAGTLEGATISGDLIIGDGAAEGDVVLKDVTVSGRLLVRGGGASTVTLEGETTVGNVVVNKPTGAVRVENNTEGTVNLAASSSNVVLTGDFNEVNANASQGTVTLNSADVATMNVNGDGSKAVVAENSTVETMNVMQSASGAAVSVQSGATVKELNSAASQAAVTVNGTVTNVNVAGANTTVKAEEGAKIEKVTTSAANTTVSGTGSVTNFEAAAGSTGADITTDGTKVTNNGTGDVSTGNDKVIASGATGTSESDNSGTTTPGGSTGGGSTGGGSGTVTTQPVSGIVGVKPVDQSESVANEDMPTVTATATQDTATKVVTIKLSTDKAVPLHQNEESNMGYWVGVAVKAPAGHEDDATANCYFGATPSEKAETPDALKKNDPNIGDGTGTYFVAWVNAGAVTPKTYLNIKWNDTDEVVKYVIDLSGVKVGIEELNVTAASQQGTDFTTIGKNFVLDENNEIPADVENKQFTQAQISALGCAHTDKQPTETCTCLYKSLTLYVKVNGKLPTFDKVTQKYMTADGKLATMEYKNNTKDWAYKDGKLAGEAGRYGEKDGNDYLKLALYAFYRPSADSTWGLISSDAAKQVLEFYNGDNKVATAEFDSPLAGYTVTDTAEGAKAELTKIESALEEGVTVTGTATAENVKTAVDAEIGTVENYTVTTSVGSKNEDGTWAVTVTVTNNSTESDTVTKIVNVTVTEKTEETVATVGELKAALKVDGINTVTVASDLGKLSENLEVPSGKTLVIAKGGALDAYDVALSGEGSVVVDGGALKINANYNNDEGSEVPTVATIRVNHGGTLASMTTDVEEAVDTKFVGPDDGARIQTTDGASVTFEFGEEPTMVVDGNVTIPKDQTWYSMFDSDKEALGIAMTQESGTMTVEGTLKVSSANGTGSSLTIGNDASIVVNGTMSIASKATFTNNGDALSGTGTVVYTVDKTATGEKINAALNVVAGMNVGKDIAGATEEQLASMSRVVVGSNLTTADQSIQIPANAILQVTMAQENKHTVTVENGGVLYVSATGNKEALFAKDTEVTANSGARIIFAARDSASHDVIGGEGLTSTEAIVLIATGNESNPNSLKYTATADVTLNGGSMPLAQGDELEGEVVLKGVEGASVIVYEGFTGGNNEWTINTSEHLAAGTYTWSDNAWTTGA